MKRIIITITLCAGAALGFAIPACEGTGGGGCCKVCKSGKPCGDSCIAVNSTCNAGPGCACAVADDDIDQIDTPDIPAD